MAGPAERLVVIKTYINIQEPTDQADSAGKTLPNTKLRENE
jgi:hypothetical protein